MRNYIFLISTATENRQKIRVKSITPSEASTIAAAIMDNNGEADVTYWAEN